MSKKLAHGGDVGEINEMILSMQNVDRNDSDDDSNSGTMIVDATCVPSQIKYPWV